MMPRTMSPPPKRPGSKWPGFLINRSGLPFDELTWSELWEFAAYLYPGSRSKLNIVLPLDNLYFKCKFPFNHIGYYINDSSINVINICI